MVVMHDKGRAGRSTGYQYVAFIQALLLRSFDETCGIKASQPHNETTTYVNVRRSFGRFALIAKELFDSSPSSPSPLQQPRLVTPPERADCTP